MDNKQVSILGAHPYSPVDAEFVERRNTLLDELFAYASVQKEALLLGGDLNITPFSPYYWQLKNRYPQLFRFTGEIWLTELMADSYAA